MNNVVKKKKKKKTTLDCKLLPDTERVIKGLSGERCCDKKVIS